MSFIKIKLLIFAVHLYLTNAQNLHQFSSSLFISGSPPMPLPTPSPLAIECLESILSQLKECANDAIKNWNITQKSPVKDKCCAQWDAIDCDLSAAKSKCTSDDLDEVEKYIEELVEYYDKTICEQYPKTSSHCVLPILSKLSDNRPPPPTPLAIDCLGNIKREVRIGCYITASRKWNVTKRSPIRNKCCAAWDDIDCLDQIAQVRCPSSEVTATEDYFKQIETWAENVACSQAAYHSSNCSNASIVDSKPQFTPYIPLPLPSGNDNPNIVVNSDYIYFMLNYMMSAFPHLLHLMILLAIILVTIVVIQCFIIARQVKQDRLLADITPRINGYHKVDA